ncbi:hypothetical protein GJ496_008719 [Pomphorhynchus laevis]|nr:hypothetical protein GJ496_008719 [Pomphorhynchus laevis]
MTTDIQETDHSCSSLELREDQLPNPNVGIFDKLQNVYKAIISNNRKLCGTLFGLLSAFSFASSSMLVKMNKSITGAEAALIRTDLMVLATGSYCLYKEYKAFNYNRKIRLQIIVRSITAIIGSTSSYSAVRFISLPDSTSLRYLSVSFTLVFARIFLKEPINCKIMFCILVSILGGVMVSHPDLFYSPSNEDHTYTLNVSCRDNHFKNAITRNNLSRIGNTMTNCTNRSGEQLKLTSIGVALSLTGALCQAITFVVMRKLISGVGNDRKMKSSEVIYNFSLFALIPMTAISFVWRIIEQNTKFEMSTIDVLLVLCGAVMGLFAQLTMNNSLKLCSASYASLVRGSEIIFAFAYQAILFKIETNFINYIGILLIASSMMAVNVLQIRMQTKA